MDGGILFGIIGIVIIVSYLAAKSKGNKIGIIQCRRCHFIGAAKGTFVPFRGEKFVCSNCGSEDWAAVQSGADEQMFEVCCPKCSQKSRVRASFLNQVVECPSCKKVFTASCSRN